MQKILIATGLYPPEIGGPATYATMLESELPKHGIETMVVPFGAVRHLPKAVRHVVYAWRLWRHAKTCDAIYALDPISVGLPAWFVSVVARKPFLIRLGGDYAWEQGQQRFRVTATLDEYTAGGASLRPLPVRILAGLQSFTVRKAKVVIVPSEYLKSIVLTWGVKENRIEVIYSALFPLLAEDSRASLRAQLAFPYPTIVTAGRLVPWKGFIALIDVIAVLKATYPDIVLVIAGEGVDGDRLRAYVHEKKLEEHVRFVGRLTKDALGAAKKAAHVFVLNTAYEGLSHEILEVMDLGTPVVTTRVGGNPELIEDGVSGLLVAFNDTEALESAVTRVLESETLRSTLIQNARMRSRDFMKEVVVTAFVEQILRGRLVDAA